jgi:hypothetical protein
MEELIQLVIKSYGVIGLVMLSPFVGVWFLWKQNQKLHDTIAALTSSSAERIVVAGDRIVEAQKQRVTDAQAIMDRLVTMVTEQSGLNKETNLALERLADLMSMMSAGPKTPK